MKTVRVVAAVIKAVNENGEPIIFATQRGYGEFKDGWEFPGGKIEEGEAPQEALKREIMEELDTEISVGELIDTIEYDYPTFHLSMDCFWCEIVNGDLVLKEHEAARWLTKEQLDEVLDTLTEREQKVLRLRFGMNDGRARTLEEVGKEFDVTRERIRQIEAKALRKLRHPSRSRKLRDYLD